MIDLRQLEQDDLEHTAYHEAGHALFAARHHMGLDAVYVRPSGTTEPTRESTWVGRTSRESRERFEPHCLATVVGRAFLTAQLALAGDAAIAVRSWEAVEDEAEAEWALVDNLGGTDLETLEEQLAILSPDAPEMQPILARDLVGLVIQFLLANRTALDGIARVLIDAGTHSLTGPEVYALVADAECVTPAGETARSAVGV